MHILPNISRTEGNQTVIMGQLIEYNLGHDFLENNTEKYGEETIPRPFSKKIEIEQISGSII